MNTEQLNEASKLWRSGAHGRDIAREIGITADQVYELASRYRHMFPKRVIRVADRVGQTIRVDGALDEVVSADRMRWITESGASVTLARVSMIDCPRRMA